MLITGQKKSFGSNAIEHFNKLTKQKQETAKKMKRGPYEHHAKVGKPLNEEELRKVKEMPKGMPASYYFNKLNN